MALWFWKSRAVFVREARTELRSRYALNAIVMFAFITLMIVAISIGPSAPRKVSAALLWLLLLFSAMTGLARIFVREMEARTSDALRLVADPIALLSGKMMFNAVLLGAVQLIVVPLYVVITGLPIRDTSLFFLFMVLGNLGLTSASTLLAAIVAKAGARNALFPVLALPILLPLLLSLVGGTYATLEPDPRVVKGVGYAPNPVEIRRTARQAAGSDVRLALAFIGIMTPAAFLLFELIWTED